MKWSKNLMRIANVCIAAGLLGIALSLAWSVEGSVPPPETKEVPETVCEEYLALPAFERIDQWKDTFKNGLSKNPELKQGVWTCVLSIDKLMQTDDFTVRECHRNTKTDFDELIFEALTLHLNLCGIVVSKS